MIVASPTLSRRGPSGLVALEIKPPSPREAVAEQALRQACERFAADVAAQAEFGAYLDATLPLFAGMTDAERAELRFALRCDPELQASLARDRRS